MDHIGQDVGANRYVKVAVGYFLKVKEQEEMVYGWGTEMNV